MLVFTAFLPVKIYSLNTSKTPLCAACLDAAKVTASYKFFGPSALMAVAGRIEPVIITGLSDRTVSDKK
ncbi:hypothetical protein D3C72_1799560 [compost metagenome]